MVDAVETVAEVPVTVTEAVAEPAHVAVGAAERETREMIGDLAEAIRINTERDSIRQDALSRIEANLSDVLNRLTQTPAAVADAVVATAGDVADTVVDVPVAGAEVVEGGVQAAVEVPAKIGKRRGVIRKRNRG